MHTAVDTALVTAQDMHLASMATATPVSASTDLEAAAASDQAACRGPKSWQGALPVAAVRAPDHHPAARAASDA